MIRRLFALALLLMLVACFAFVWPSLYRYDHMTVDGDVYPVRIQRVTGHADILLPEQGWIPPKRVGIRTRRQTRRAGVDAARAPRRPLPAATLAALERARSEFGGDAGARKLDLIAALDAARLGSARDVLRFHDTLCFLRAYPDDARVLEGVTARLESFERRPDFARHRAALADSGIAGTTIRFRFFAAMASWLAWRWPGQLGLDWRAVESPGRIEHYLPLFAAAAEIPALDEYDVPLRDRLARMKRPDEGDGALLARGFERAFLTDALFSRSGTISTCRSCWRPALARRHARTITCRARRGRSSVRRSTAHGRISLPSWRGRRSRCATRARRSRIASSIWRAPRW